MYGQTHRRRQVLRNSALLKRLPFAIGLFALLGLLGDDPAGAWIFGVGAVLMAVFACRPSVTIAPEGLIVSNMLARRYLWAEIADVTSHYCFYGPALRLDLHDGSHKYAWAVMSGQRHFGEGWIEQTIGRVRGRWLLETAPPLR